MLIISYVSQIETRWVIFLFLFAAKSTFDNSVSVGPKGDVVKMGIYWANEQRKESEVTRNRVILKFSL